MRPSTIFRLFALGLCLILLAGFIYLPKATAEAYETTGTTYYVSSSAGDDSYAGTEAKPFATIAKVNSLALQPGDHVLFKCADSWQAEQLVVSYSGTSVHHYLQFLSQGCTNKPNFSGRKHHRVDGVCGQYLPGKLSSAHSTGINQLFRMDTADDGALPNLDNGSAAIPLWIATVPAVTRSPIINSRWIGRERSCISRTSAGRCSTAR